MREYEKKSAEDVKFHVFCIYENNISNCCSTFQIQDVPKWAGLILLYSQNKTSLDDRNFGQNAFDRI